MACLRLWALMNPFPNELKSNHYRAGRRHRISALGLAAALQLLPICRVRAEDHVDYRYENYGEENHRIKVETHSLLFETRLKPWLSAKGEVVYDAISGASPTGAPPPSTINFVPAEEGGPAGPFSNRVPLSKLQDTRYAVTFELPATYQQHHLSPQFSYSEEDDYLSLAAALNYSIDLNQKNTTLNTGWAHNWDTIRPKGFLFSTAHKDSDDFLIGVNQLLGPATVMTVNLSYGRSHGYLNDQYKGVLFDNDVQLDPVSPALTAEKRPETRNRYIAYTSLTQDIAPLDASIEGSYRFFHDSYGINAHTLGLAWFQKLGSAIVLSPIFRYYWQTEAGFYATRFPNSAARPEFYSADYRLSHLQSLTYGFVVSIKPVDWITLDAGFRRYTMRGLDNVTSQSAYPKANIFTLGARVWF
ncbi:MAG: hypothetical protein JWM16_1656 [Verrucomicrobiales bacterium]|nr:hypothetical protein [Verrucomicrobiales bacterium]